jgi:hypothetical protein
MRSMSGRYGRSTALLQGLDAPKAVEVTDRTPRFYRDDRGQVIDTTATPMTGQPKALPAPKGHGMDLVAALAATRVRDGLDS